MQIYEEMVLKPAEQSKAQTNIRIFSFYHYSDTKNIGNQLFICCFQWYLLIKLNKSSTNNLLILRQLMIIIRSVSEVVIINDLK